MFGTSDRITADHLDKLQYMEQVSLPAVVYDSIGRACKVCIYC